MCICIIIYLAITLLINLVRNLDRKETIANLKAEIEDIKKHMRRPTENIDPEFFEYTQDLSDKEKKKVAEYINYIKSIRDERPRD